MLHGHCAARGMNREGVCDALRLFSSCGRDPNRELPRILRSLRPIRCVIELMSSPRTARDSDLFEVAEGEPEHWLLFSSEPLDVAYLLSDWSERCEPSAPPRPDAVEASPADVLRWHAFRVEPVPEHVAGMVRRRISKKRSRGTLELLRDIRSGDWHCLTGEAPESWKQSESLRNYFRSVLAKATGVPSIHSRQVTASSWLVCAKGVKGGWAVARRLVQEKMVVCKDDDGKDPATARISGLGVLFTWHTRIGMSDPAVRELLAEGLEGGALLERLKQLQMVDDAFDDFCAFVDDLRQKAGYAWWGACMELCMHGDYAARIHLHAFLSIDPARSGNLKAMTPPSLPIQACLYDGVAPSCRPVKLTGRSRNMEMAFSGGMYYVLCDKIGSMRVRGNKALFLELRG